MMRDQDKINKVKFSIVFELALFVLCASVFGTVSSYASEAKEKTEIFVISSPVNASVRFIQKVGNDMLQLEENTNFNIKAYIEPVLLLQKMILRQKELNLQEERFECRDFPCTQKWEFDLSEKVISIKDLPHLQLMWNQSQQGSIPEILVDAELFSKEAEQKAIHISGYFNRQDDPILEPLVTINMKDVEYTGKSRRFYLAKRELGLKADTKWRYIMDGKNLVLQSRVDQPLSKFQAVQVVLDQNFVPEKVQFSVDSTGNGRRDTFILFEQTRHSLEKKNGQAILTFDLRDAIKQLGIDPEKAVLMEPIIFMPTNSQTFMRDKPIHKIIFASMDSKDEEVLIIPQMVRKGNRYYLDFDFSRAVEDQLVGDGILKKLIVTARLDGPQAISMEKIRLFDTFEEQIPVIAEEPGKAFQSWVGGEIELGPFERIGSFNPLMWVWKKKEQSPPLTFHGEKVQSINLEISSGKTFNFPFSDVVFFKENNKSYKQTWLSPKGMVRGEIVPHLIGRDNLYGNITIQQQGSKKNSPIFLTKVFDFSKAILGLSGLESKLVNFEEIEANIPEGENREYELGFFDVTSENITPEFDFIKSEWWLKEAEVPFVSQDESIRIDEEKGKMYFFPGEGNKKKWSLILPDAEFIAPLGVLISGSFPLYCQARLKINGQSISVVEGYNEIPSFVDSSHSNTIIFEIENRGEDAFFSIDIPKLSVLGLKRTSMDEIKKMALTIGETKIPIPIFEFPDAKGVWVDLGQVSLEKGEHYLSLTNSQFLKFKTLMFETESILQLSEKEQIPVVKTTIWEKLLLLGFELLLVAFAAGVFYVFRAKIKAGFLSFWVSFYAIFVKKYWILSERVWLMFWLFGAVGLYGLSLLSSSNRENYFITFGGVFMVVFLWHLGRLLKDWLLKHFPKIGEAVYRNWSTSFFAWAIVLLVIMAICVAVRLEPLAEQLAIVAYYCLVAGVAGEIVSFKKEKQLDNT